MISNNRIKFYDAIRKKMNFWKKIKLNVKQIVAIAEKNTKMYLRFKVGLITDYIKPLISLIFPFIIMGAFFTFQENFGPWNRQNYIIYLMVGYSILQLNNIVQYIPSNFKSEKYSLTLQALMMAPFHRYNLLLGYILAYLVKISLSLILFMTLCYIFFPISFLTLLLLLFCGFLLIFTYAGFGFMIGGFEISNEPMARICNFIILMIFALSCVLFPFQIFPDFIQFFINLNPVYYIIDIFRLIWIEDDVYITLSTHPYHIIILFCFATIVPVYGLYLFNRTYKKHGIVGY